MWMLLLLIVIATIAIKKSPLSTAFPQVLGIQLKAEREVILYGMHIFTAQSQFALKPFVLFLALRLISFCFLEDVNINPLTYIFKLHIFLKFEKSESILNLSLLSCPCCYLMSQQIAWYRLYLCNCTVPYEQSRCFIHTS